MVLPVRGRKISSGVAPARRGGATAGQRRQRLEAAAAAGGSGGDAACDGLRREWAAAAI